jgi:DNA-binding NarL/FixJ family response regulator
MQESKAQDGKAGRNSKSTPKQKATGAKLIRILIVEDHKVVREGLRMLIESQDDMGLVAESSAFDQALAAVRKEKPDIVLLDLDLGGVNIVERIPEILKASQDARIVVLTGIPSVEPHLRALRLGALGLVLKFQSGETVLKAIRKVNTGEAWIDRSMTASLVVDISTAEDVRAREAAKIGKLSHREREIVTVLCEGLNNKQIADRLFVSEFTIRNHVTSVLAKLQLVDRFELAIYAFRHGLAKPPH